MISFLLMALASTQLSQNETIITAAKEAVVQDFLDPSSAQFRSTYVKSSPIGNYVCGEVNGKNTYGGYVGFRRFVFNEATGATIFEPLRVQLSTNSGTDFYLAWTTNCESTGNRP